MGRPGVMGVATEDARYKEAVRAWTYIVARPSSQSAARRANGVPRARHILRCLIFTQSRPEKIGGQWRSFQSRVQDGSTHVCAISVYILQKRTKRAHLSSDGRIRAPKTVLFGAIFVALPRRLSQMGESRPARQTSRQTSVPEGAWETLSAFVPQAIDASPANQLARLLASCCHAVFGPRCSPSLASTV